MYKGEHKGIQNLQLSSWLKLKHKYIRNGKGNSKDRIFPPKTKLIHKLLV